jgi:hypothetical protein
MPHYQSNDMHYQAYQEAPEFKSDRPDYLLHRQIPENQGVAKIDKTA